MDLINLYIHPSGEATRPVQAQPTGVYKPDSQAPVSRNIFYAAGRFNEPIEQFQPIRVPKQKPPPRRRPAAVARRRKGSWGCLASLLVLPILAVFLVYFFLPARTNILILGIDRAPEGTDASRTDTNIVLSINPLRPIVNMLSIPRDLWVNIPNEGENRINTAHFFAEANDPGSGPRASMQTIQENFGIPIDYYVRIRFDGVKEIVDAMGGLNIALPEAMSGYEAGTHLLDGDQALAFVRDRSGTDDFFRMQRGQLAAKAMIKQSLQPSNWPKLPAAAVAATKSMDNNIPVWQMPRIGLAVARAALFDSINNQTITREMVTPFTTSEGAMVLLPNWDLINPLLMELFGQ